MDELIKRLTEQGTTGEGIFSIPEFLTSLTVALICCGIFAYVYRTTHRGLSYSVSYVHTLFIMGITTSVTIGRCVPRGGWLGLFGVSRHQHHGRAQ